MIIGDDWFTKSMLVNTIARNEKLQSQLGKTASGNENLFTTILENMMQHQHEVLKRNQNATFISSHMLGENQVSPLNLPFSLQVSSTNEPLSYRPISSDKINQVLGGKLTGMGEAFVRAGQAYNVDPALLTAIAQHETGNGNSRAAIEKNNIAGMMGRNGLRSYMSVEESIMDMARNLSKNYLGQGLSSVAEIGKKYAPIGANNDPTGLNNHWVNGVSHLMNRLT